MCLSTKCVPASKKFYRSPLFVFLHSEIPSYFWTEQQSNMAMLTFIRNPHTKKGIFDISFPVFPITKLSPNLFLFFRHHSEWTFLSCYLFYSLNPQSTTPFSLSSCSVSQSVQSLNHCLTLCDPMDCSMPGFPVHHKLLELAQTHVHWVGYATHHLILCHSLFLLPSVFPSIRVVSSESVLCIRWPRYWSFSISPSNEYSGLISLRIDWFDLLAVQETCKSLLQHHSSKALILQHSAFLMVQLSHSYMTTGKTIALTTTWPNTWSYICSYSLLKSLKCAGNS